MIHPSRQNDRARLSLLLAVLLYTVGMVAHPLVHAAEQGSAVVEAEQNGTSVPPVDADGEICQFLCQTNVSPAPAGALPTFAQAMPESRMEAVGASPERPALGHRPTLPRDPPLA